MAFSDFSIIDTDEAALRLVASATGACVVAVDTEFDRSRTFYAKAGLIQLALAGHVYLIDPLEVSIESYKLLITSEENLKLFHSCSEDLELLARLCGAAPQPIIDTQLAATYAGMRPQMGYQAIVQEIVGVEIPKHQTRSDWLKRPLSSAQLEYAALDVLYLEQIYQYLKEKLQKLGRWQWVEEDCQVLVRTAEKTLPYEKYYRTIGNAWQLRPKQLAVLRGVSSWREEEVRKKDLPRSFLLSDALIWEIAKQIPTNIESLNCIDGFRPGIIKKYGDTILQLVIQANSLSQQDLPAIVPEPISKAAPAVIKKLKALIRQLAEKIQIPAEVLARKRLLEALMVSYVDANGDHGAMVLPPELEGWRSEMILAPLLGVLDKHRSGLVKLRQ